MVIQYSYPLEYVVDDIVDDREDVVQAEDSNILDGKVVVSDSNREHEEEGGEEKEKGLRKILVVEIVNGR